MRRNKFLGFLFVFALVLFALPLLPPPLNPIHRVPAPSRASDVHTASKKEMIYKQLTVQRDMEATERLSRSQITRDVHLFLVKGGYKDGSGESVQALLKTHPEMLYVEWMKGNERITAGSIAPGLNLAAKPYLTSARSSVQLGKAYSSPTFTYGGKSYFVFSHMADQSKQSVVALISADVVQAVERHQRRNLRLVPFPPEGRYRIESVVPGSNKETTVRSGEDNGNASHYAIDEIVVKFRSSLTEKQLLQLRKELDLSVVRHTGKTYVFRSKKHETMQLKKYFLSKWNPVYVEPHYLYLTNSADGPFASNGSSFVPNDTLYAEYQWNMPEIAAQNGWNVTNSKDVIVAVVDTGVQSDHPDLKGRLVTGMNIVDPSKPPEDDVGHGTHVAGIISAIVNNNEGVAGMTLYTKIMPVKVLDSSGAGSTYSVAQGIIWATDHGAHVINMSLGNYTDAQFLHDALKYAHDHGVVLVAASGNDNTNRPGYPAAYPEVLAVAATDQTEGRAVYSNYGDYIGVAAPGTSIASTYPGSRYAALSGTSMASPHVAALASLVRAANSQLTNDQIMVLLERTARDLGKPGKDNEFGYGQIDVKSALQAASGLSNSLQLFPQQVRSELEQLKKK